MKCFMRLHCLLVRALREKKASTDMGKWEQNVSIVKNVTSVCV